VRTLNAALQSSKALVGVNHLQSTLPSNRNELVRMEASMEAARRAAARASSSLTDILATQAVRAPVLAGDVEALSMNEANPRTFRQARCLTRRSGEPIVCVGNKSGRRRVKSDARNIGSGNFGRLRAA
jgi:hypothetical protein